MKTEDRYPWKEGMEVAVLGSLHGMPIIHKIVKLTAAQVVVDDGYRYWRKNGYGMGCRYSIEPATQEHHDLIEGRRVAAYLRDVPWRELPLSVLKDIEKLARNALPKD